MDQNKIHLFTTYEAAHTTTFGTLLAVCEVDSPKFLSTRNSRTCGFIHVIRALFTSIFFYKIEIVTFLFVFDKYCSIIN